MYPSSSNMESEGGSKNSWFSTVHWEVSASFIAQYTYHFTRHKKKSLKLRFWNVFSILDFWILICRIDVESWISSQSRSDSSWGMIFYQLVPRCHRLDANTSVPIIIAKNLETWHKFRKQFSGREVCSRILPWLCCSFESPPGANISQESISEFAWIWDCLAEDDWKFPCADFRTRREINWAV